MAAEEKIRANSAGGPAPAEKSGRKVEFDGNIAFQTELRRRVDEYFKKTGRSKRGDWRMYLKTAVILAGTAATYVLLVFFTTSPLQVIALSIALGFGAAAIGFNIQHDGGHNSYSERRWINKLMAATLDLIGGSSHVWHWKHAVIHHTYVNITGYDTDIEINPFGRLSPHQRRHWFHRWQHVYLWLLYGLLAMKWHLIDDFQYVIRGGIGPHRLPRPRGWGVVAFIAGKLAFYAVALVIPMLFHPVPAVLACYLIAVAVLGMTLSTVFQIPHCVGEADFPMPRDDTGRMEYPWAVHQTRVTLDFERRGRLVTWLLGGLNYHIEHHLFPVICHVHYPAISGIVEQTCGDFGLRYGQHPTFWSGLAAHYRWLRKMGMPPPAADSARTPYAQS